MSNAAIARPAFPAAGERRRSRARWEPAAATDLLRLSAGADPSAAAVRQEQVREMARAAPLSILSAAGTAGLAAVALWNEVPRAQLLLWLFALLLILAFRGEQCRRLRASPLGPAQVHRAFVGTIAGVSAMALLWLVPAFCWFGTANASAQIVVTMIVIGLMSGGTSNLASVPPAAAAFIVILGLALLRITVQYGNAVMAGLAVILTLVLIHTVLSSARLFSSHVMGRRELEEQGQLIKLLREFQSSGSEWLWEVDGDLRISFMSRAMAASIGVPLEALLGRDLRRLIDPDGHHCEMSQGVRTLFGNLDRELAFHELAVPTRDGSKWYCLSGRPVHDPHGRLVGWRGVGSDITNLRHGTGSEGPRVARHDPLTGLGNRLLVREMIEEARLKQSVGDGSCCLLLLDLDRFKLVNDTLGHAMGDRLLVDVAQRLESICGPDAGVGRLGGDEFAIVWRGAPDALTLMDLAERIVAEVDSGFMIGPTPIHIGVSIGIARAPLDGETQDQLMRSADLALYRAKEQRGQHCFYEPWMLAKAQAERLLENDVREAVRRGDLHLHYQPIVDAATLSVVGHEALLRWWHPVRGAIGPDVFVPIIEDVGLIHQIGDWVIHEACNQAARWPGEQRVAVNVSVAQLTGAGLRRTVEDALAKSGLAPRRLELEVTESVFLGDDAATLGALSSLQGLGVRLVLDDFGKGYSSFGYLSRACFSKIKIDQLFVRGAASGHRDYLAIVQSILALAHGLGVETTAEGVETTAHADLMSALGCTQLQGYLFGRPVPANSIDQTHYGSPPDRPRLLRSA